MAPREHEGQCGICGKCGCFTRQREIFRAVSCDEAKRTLRRRAWLLAFTAGRLRLGKSMTADDGAILWRRSERRHAQADAAHQSLDCKRVSDHNGEEAALSCPDEFAHALHHCKHSMIPLGAKSGDNGPCVGNGPPLTAVMSIPTGDYTTITRHDGTKRPRCLTWVIRRHRPGRKQVRFSIKSGHRAVIGPCPRCAKRGHFVHSAGRCDHRLELEALCRWDRAWLCEAP